ncbi:MAG: 5'-nucleotidase, lipoprotein e(P4) family [Steroidobacteraceae bacterium]
MKKLIVALLGMLSIPLAVARPAATPALPVTAREQLNATLWLQRATEYELATLQVYRLATERLTTVIAAPGSAATEQWGVAATQFATLPTAIVVDLDETVLDNTYYQARQLLQGREYDEASWQAWMQEAAATAIPGAVEFLRLAAAAGHRIFYVTNRLCQRLESSPDDPCPARTATLRNLRVLGLPNLDDPESLMLRGERPQWSSSDKSVRRSAIAERYRIVALVGDDLRDFVDRSVFESRRGELAHLFGTRWFLLPNPIYGSWERELTSGACAPSMSATDCGAQTLKRKYQQLKPQPGVRPTP